MSQPPTSKYPDMGEVTTLRLELCRERDRANAFEKAITTEVLKVAKVAIYQAMLDADSKAADTIGCMGVEVDDLKAENARLKAEVEAYRSASDEVAAAFLALPAPHNQVARVCEGIESLKAEVERLTERNKFLEQIDSYLQGANENTYEKRCDELEAEVERLKEGNECLDKMHEKEMARSAYLLEEFNRTTAWGRGLESDLSHARVEISFLKAEAERLRKAGDAMQKRLIFLHDRWDSDEPNIESEAWNAAKEGKPSV